MALLKKKKTRKVDIPSASQADIAFLLLLFFICTTTVDVDKGIGLILPPEGDSPVEISKKNITTIVIDPQGNVLIDNKEVEINQIRDIAERLQMENPKMIFSVKAHPRCRYDKYVAVLDQLKMAKATRISIAE
ncbi:MAG TPA: biopolymer transporter ExbD [Candidatus Marinimicrobia bacterium]|jgi:biopolymer transport protein ExbD|nr:biopolymer transporter ExbD [Candidatus Neomarinimicrobiota bacterium]HOO13780.1 biopolymer transporter ExbD [Candidatus Neomarinimicrobiota bacterium]HPA99591.1 biopolymer transporter ExbD [Candidatus Neomarinimicrobiota bacterium]HPD25637.1 biopolymer transporter ExbD [Candidatus Neomarinimicrobiota bacterium]HPY00880.1 biopolymer transporter ExbD [Candidatus Neomarinimicrobiota bacterium]